MNRIPDDTLSLDQLSPKIAEWLKVHGIDPASPLASAGKAGSGRRYYRASMDEGNAVVMLSPTVDADFHRFVQISGYLRRRGVEVPRLHAIDSGAGQIAMDDFGGVQLHALLLAPESRAAGWRVGLECLDALQRRCERFEKEGPELLLDRSFDFKAVRWETDYFAEHYLDGVLGWDREEIGALSAEFDALALQVAQHPTVLMHRDFQSQNLMAVRGVDRSGKLTGEPLRLGVLDYQGARGGSHWYDLASMLWDPYVGATEDEVMGLWREWCCRKQIEPDVERLTQFIAASLQRLMQACGAYGRLGKREGIPFFRQWIGPGARQLQRAMKLYPSDDLPRLRAAVERLNPPQEPFRN